MLEGAADPEHSTTYLDMLAWAPPNSLLTQEERTQLRKDVRKLARKKTTKDPVAPGKGKGVTKK